MSDRRYCTYMVASRTRVLYIGMTSHIELRMVQHKTKRFEGFTADYNCNRLVWYQIFDDVRRAIAREKQLKGWTRAKKLALIERVNPTWIDLSEDWGKPLQLLPTDYLSRPPIVPHQENAGPSAPTRDARLRSG